MDALAKLNEHFLSCNICTETFKDPCTLGCYHTFCRECLTKYTKTRKEAITAKSILCPNCCHMTKVPQPQEPVDQWCEQFKPSFLIQGLLDSFVSQESEEPVGHCCFTCQQFGKTTQAYSICEDCDIKFCEACAKMHLEAPYGKDHVISPMGAGSTLQLKKRKVMCKEHKCLVEFCCRDCQKAVCHKCCIVYHRKCHAVVTLDLMIPEMKQVLQQNYDDIELHRQQTGNTLKRRRSEVEEITQHKFSLQSEIRRVSQQAVDLIRRKEKKLLDELDTLTEKQTGELRGQIKSGEIDLQTYQQYTEFIKQVLQSNSTMDLYDMYTLCQSGEITAEIQRQDKQGDRTKKVEFYEQLDVDQLDRTLQLGHLKVVENRSNTKDTIVPLSTVSTDTWSSLQCTPQLQFTVSTDTWSSLQCKPQLQSTVSTDTWSSLQCTPQLQFTVSTKSKDNTKTPDINDIEIMTIGGTETLVVTDYKNKSIKSCYTEGGKSYCTSLQLDESPHAITKISQDRVAVSYISHNSIELIKLTPYPVRITTIKTKKKYRCLTALSDTTLAAGCVNPPSIDVLDLSGRVLRSMITPSTGQQLIQRPQYMCTTRQGHIVVVDVVSGSVYCVTQQGEVLYTYKLTGRYWIGGGVTTTDTGSVIVVDYYDNKIVQLTERGDYMRDLLTGQDGIVKPQGIRVHGNKLYVTGENREHVKIYQS